MKRVKECKVREKGVRKGCRVERTKRKEKKEGKLSEDKRKLEVKRVRLCTKTVRSKIARKSLVRIEQE